MRGAFRRAEELLLQRRGSEVYLKIIGIITENNGGTNFEHAGSEFDARILLSLAGVTTDRSDFEVTAMRMSA